MYVCLCKGITDQHIREEVVNGANHLRDIVRNLGLAKDWDTCFIEGNYLNTVLSYGSSRGFSFNLSGNYATIKTDAPATVKKSSYHVQYSGTYGSSGGTLRVSGDYSHVNLNKN